MFYPLVEEPLRTQSPLLMLRAETDGVTGSAGPGMPKTVLFVLSRYFGFHISLPLSGEIFLGARSEVGAADDYLQFCLGAPQGEGTAIKMAYMNDHGCQDPDEQCTQQDGN